MLFVLPQRVLRTVLRNLKWGHGEKTEYYFAYGANLDESRFVKNRMNFERIGVVELKEHQVEFTLPCEYKDKGYASVRRENGKSVWGVLYKLDKKSLLLLDVLEWKVFRQYKRVFLPVTNEKGENTLAWVYQAAFPKPGLFPPKVYLEAILTSSAKEGFPESYLTELRRVESREGFELDPTFSFLHPNKPRIASHLNVVRKVYSFHDRIREKLCELLR